MSRLSSKVVITMACLLVLVIAIPVALRFVHAQQGSSHNTPSGTPGITSTPTSQRQSGTNPTPHAITDWPLISRNVPAFASSANYPAANADDASYDTTWRSAGVPAWIAYDLSNVPANDRRIVLVVWYNDSFNYDHTIINADTYNQPRDYTIDANPAAGGQSPPPSGWVTLLSVKGNHYHSRQHVINLSGYNWIRMNITAVDGSAQNFDAGLNLDIFDAAPALADDWIFFGDSITALSMAHYTVSGAKSFAELIHARNAAYFPVQEAGGIGYLTSFDGAKYLSTWLKMFPGKYVALSYGTNDALGCVDPSTFYNNYVAMVQGVLSLGKIPIVPLMPWGAKTSIQNCGPALNAEIADLYTAFPQVVKGPDLWTFFEDHPQLISSDGIHPDEAGEGAYRQLWAMTMLKLIVK